MRREPRLAVHLQHASDKHGGRTKCAAVSYEVRSTGYAKREEVAFLGNRSAELVHEDHRRTGLGGIALRPYRSELDSILGFQPEALTGNAKVDLRPVYISRGKSVRRDAPSTRTSRQQTQCSKPQHGVGEPHGLTE